MKHPEQLVSGMMCTGLSTAARLNWSWLERVPGGAVEFISTEMARFDAAFAGTRFADSPRRNAPRALAGAIGKIACERLQRGDAGDPAMLDANYVRRSDAELFWKE